MKLLTSILSIIALLVILNCEKISAQSEAELVEICTMISDGATYLKDFKAKLEANPPAPA